MRKIIITLLIISMLLLTSCGDAGESITGNSVWDSIKDFFRNLFSREDENVVDELPEDIVITKQEQETIVETEQEEEQCSSNFSLQDLPEKSKPPRISHKKRR